MGAFLGLLVGVGALLIWQGLTPRLRGPRRHPRADRVREELAQAGLSGVTPNQLLAVQVMVAVLVVLIGIVVTGSLSVSLLFGLFASVGPRLLVARLRRKRQADLRDLWPEVVDNLISGVRAGLSLPEALSSLGTRGPEPLREPFRRFGSDYRTTGKFGDCLDRLKTALADPVGDRVCESLRVAREVGGTDLGRLLATLSAFLREDARTRAELLARQSWSVKADHRIKGIDRPVHPYELSPARKPGGPNWLRADRSTKLAASSPGQLPRCPATSTAWRHCACRATGRRRCANDPWCRPRGQAPAELSSRP